MDQRSDERFKSNLTVKLAQGKGIAHNVSASGIYFVTDVALPQGEPVKFTFEFQDLPGGAIHINCIARVVRVEKRGNKKGVGAAIDSFEFLRIARSRPRPLAVLKERRAKLQIERTRRRISKSKRANVMPRTCAAIG